MLLRYCRTMAKGAQTSLNHIEQYNYKYASDEVKKKHRKQYGEALRKWTLWADELEELLRQHEGHEAMTNPLPSAS